LEKVKAAQKGLFFLAMGIATIWSFQIPPAMNFQNPQLARIFVWHFPCPMIAVSGTTIGAGPSAGAGAATCGWLGC